MSRRNPNWIFTETCKRCGHSARAHGVDMQACQLMLCPCPVYLERQEEIPAGVAERDDGRDPRD